MFGHFPATRALIGSGGRGSPLHLELSGWMMVLWTDEDVEAFVQSNAPANYLKTYNKYIHPIQRIDAFRIVLLKTHGGLYVDLDNECMQEPVTTHLTVAFDPA